MRAAAGGDRGIEEIVDDEDDGSPPAMRAAAGGDRGVLTFTKDPLNAALPQ